MTTAVRMDAFNIEQVRNLTSSDSLNLDTFGQQRDALFIITPTNDRTYNFLVCFLYTQLFDSMFTFGETLSAGSKDLKLTNGELVRHFSKEQVKDGSFVDDTVAVLKNAHYEKVNGKGELEGYNKKTKKHITFFDGWYDILDANENLISRRPTEKLAKEYIDDLKSAKLVNGNGESMPQHVRCLMDEFPNIGEIPEFLDKLSTIRKYEISCVVICQTITQLKGMYEKNYETIDQDCDTTIFLGGDENSNNEYFAKKIGDATVRGSGNSVDNKKVSASYNIDSRQLMKPEELGRMPRSEELIFITGEQPARDTKYDYPSHKNYPFTHDYCMDFGIVEGSVFDRGIYGQTEPIQPIRKADVASAVPTIEAFTVDKFKSIFFTQNEAEAMSRMENAFMRFSLSDSEAATFG
jgi:hypothetical protein